MRLNDVSIVIMMSFIALSVAIFAGNAIKDAWWPDDNAVEEYVERKLEGETGLDVDLTPLSPES